MGTARWAERVVSRPKDSTLAAVVALIFAAGWVGTAAAMRILGVS